MSNPLLQIRDNGQITIPTSIRRKTNLKSGDMVEVLIESDGSIRLIPQITIDRSQAYFWTERWQEGEHQAEEDIHSGRVKKFDNADDLIADLESPE